MLFWRSLISCTNKVQQQISHTSAFSEWSRTPSFFQERINKTQTAYYNYSAPLQISWLVEHKPQSHPGFTLPQQLRTAFSSACCMPESRKQAGFMALNVSAIYSAFRTFALAQCKASGLNALSSQVVWGTGSGRTEPWKLALICISVTVPVTALVHLKDTHLHGACRAVWLPSPLPRGARMLLTFPRSYKKTGEQASSQVTATPSSVFPSFAPTQTQEG